MNWVKRFLAAKLSSRCYAITYIACIPAFACVYTLISTDFHYAIAIHERSIARDLETIKVGIERTLNHRIAVDYKDSQVVSNGWVLSGNKIGVNSIEFKDGVFSCSLMMVLERQKNNSPERLRGTLATMNFNQFGMPMVKNDGTYDMIMKLVNLDFNGFADFNPYVLLAKPPAGFTGEMPEIHFLPIPLQLNKAILAYDEAANGFPANSSGTLLRMCYFSAVTITTLGYGDILPLTDRARMFVAMEAILGIVIIGYYLASLATPPNGQGMGGRPQGQPH